MTQVSWAFAGSLQVSHGADTAVVPLICHWILPAEPRVVDALSGLIVPIWDGSGRSFREPDEVSPGWQSVRCIRAGPRRQSGMDYGACKSKGQGRRCSITTGVGVAVRKSALATIALAAAYGSAATASQTGAPVPHLQWSACPPAQPGSPSLAGFECATMAVPLDYSDPGGRKIELGLVKRPAAGPGRRIGTLFFNPGGPSDQGSVFLPGLFSGFPAQVAGRFDIVRGIPAAWAA